LDPSRDQASRLSSFKTAAGDHIYTRQADPTGVGWGGGCGRMQWFPVGRIAPRLNATVSIPLPRPILLPVGETLLELRREFAGTLLDVCPVQNCARGGRAEGSGSASIRGSAISNPHPPSVMRSPRLRRLSRRALPRDGDISELGTEVGP